MAPLLAGRYRRASREVKEPGTTQGAMGKRMGVGLQRIAGLVSRVRPMQDTIDVEVTPLPAACGAEIKGVDLTRPLAAETVAALKDAWGKHLVLLFRGQKLSEDDQLRFASYFGTLGDRRKAPEALRS